MKQKIFTIILMMILILLLCACDRKETHLVQYKEQAIQLPEEICSITDVDKIEDTIYIAGMNENKSTIEIWETQDNCNSWKKVFDIASILKNENITADSFDVFISKCGQYVLWCSNDENDYIFVFDLNGSVVKMNDSFVKYATENFVSSVEALNQSKLLCISSFGEGMIYDIENDTYKEIEMKDEAILYCETKDEALYFLTENGLCFFDYNGDPCVIEDENVEVFNKYISSATVGFDTSFSFASQENRDFIYAVDEQQIVKFSAGKKDILVKREKTSLGNSHNSLFRILSLNSDEILMAVQTENETILSKLVQTAETSNDKQITIYSLEENSYLQQIVYMYQKQHPKLDVVYEIGRETDEISKDDAIKRLNSRLIGGEGPDIILLEGLPQEKYIEQGMLEDLHEFVGEQTNEKDLFSSIVTSYCVEDKQYTIPIYFSMMTVSSINNIENIDTIENFIGYLEKCSKEENISVFENWSYDQIISIMYRLYMPDFQGEITEDTEKQIEEFYSAIKKTHDLVDMEIVEESGKNFDNISLIPLGYNNFDLIFTGDVQVAMDYIMCDNDIQKVQLLDENHYNYFFAISNEKKLSVPTMTLGITNKNNVDDAKAFIAFALSKQVQKEITYAGLPVNKEAMSERLKSISGDEIVIETELGTTRELKSSDFKNGEIDSWMKIFEEASCVSMLDQKVFQLIMGEVDSVLNQGQDAKDAAKEACRKINLYLNE